MADLAVRTSGDIHVEESIMQDTKPSAVALSAGQLVYEDNNGKWALADADLSAAAADAYGIVVKSVPANFGVTAVRLGVLDGFNLDSQAPGTKLYNSNTAGAIADAAPGVNGKQVGRVTSAWHQLLGNAADRLFLVDCR